MSAGVQCGPSIWHTIHGHFHKREQQSSGNCRAAHLEPLLVGGRLRGGQHLHKALAAKPHAAGAKAAQQGEQGVDPLNAWADDDVNAVKARQATRVT